MNARRMAGLVLGPLMLILAAAAPAAASPWSPIEGTFALESSGFQVYTLSCDPGERLRTPDAWGVTVVDGAAVQVKPYTVYQSGPGSMTAVFGVVPGDPIYARLHAYCR